MDFQKEKLNDLNNQLEKVMLDMGELKRCEKILNSLRLEHVSLQKKMTDIEEQLKKEEKDVERLTSISFANFLHTVLNDKIEKLDKEKREVLQVKLKYDNAKVQFNECDRQIKRLEIKCENLKNSYNQYEKLIEEKKDIIQIHFPDKWEDIYNLLEKEREISNKLKEIEEAIKAGKKVLDELRMVEDTLRSASNWGTFDILGGGMLTTMAKHQKMEEAQGYIHTLQRLLSRFVRELKDVDTYLNIDLNMNNFLGFADYFFDGIFVDWAVQSKIHDALEKINQANMKVTEVVNNLERERHSLIMEKKNKGSKVKELIQAI